MILYGMRVPVAVWQVRLRTAVSVYFTLLLLLLLMYFSLQCFYAVGWAAGRAPGL